MIRVLQYIGSMELGGSQSMIMNLYRNIDRSLIQFDFVVHADGITPLAKEAQKMGALVYECPQFSLKTAYAYVKWWNDFFEQHDYKIIHSHVRSTAAIVLKIAKKHGCITVAHSHNTSLASGFSSVIKAVLQHQVRYVSDYFIGCSQAAGEWLFGRKICATDRYFNHPNAIDVDMYIYDREMASSVRSSLGYGEEDIVVGHVGRFAEPKNHLFLIDIFSELYHENPRYKLLLVGDGSLRNAITEKIAKLGLQDAVQMPGVRRDVYALMQAMDVFLFPSLYEGLPVSVVEAQAAGLKCVISDNITDEVCITGLVNRVSLKKNARDWADIVRGVFPYERCNSKNQIEQSGYDIHTSVKRLAEFYTRLIC